MQEFDHSSLVCSCVRKEEEGREKKDEELERSFQRGSVLLDLKGYIMMSQKKCKRTSLMRKKEEGRNKRRFGAWDPSGYGKRGMVPYGKRYMYCPQSQIPLKKDFTKRRNFPVPTNCTKINKANLLRRFCGAWLCGVWSISSLYRKNKNKKQKTNLAFAKVRKGSPFFPCGEGWRTALAALESARISRVPDEFFECGAAKKGK